MPVERFEPSTLAGLVFETSAYTVPPHRLAVGRTYHSASDARSQELYPGGFLTKDVAWHFDELEQYYLVLTGDGGEDKLKGESRCIIQQRDC